MDPDKVQLAGEMARRADLNILFRRVCQQERLEHKTSGKMWSVAIYDWPVCRKNWLNVWQQALYCGIERTSPGSGMDCTKGRCVGRGLGASMKEVRRWRKCVRLCESFRKLPVTFPRSQAIYCRYTT